VRFRTGWFPYVLAAIWAAVVVASLVDMAVFSGSVRAANPPPSAAAKVRTPHARIPPRAM
jgi:hypothetical protein